MEPIRQKIVLEMDAGGIKGNGLEALIKQLDLVETHIQKVNAALAGVKLGPGAARTVEQLNNAIKKLQGQGVGLKVGELTKGLGVDQAAFEQFLMRQKKNIASYKSNTQEFRSAAAAARALNKFERESVLRRTTLGDLLVPKVSTVAPTAAAAASGGSATVPGAAVSAKVEGMIQLIIPATQVQASVVGPIGVAATGGGAGGHMEGGKWIADQPALPFGGGGGGGKGGKGGKKKGGKAGLMISPQAGELGRVRTETEDSLREAVSTVDAAGDLITTTHDSVEGIIKTVSKHKTAQNPLTAFREARRVADENFKQAKAALDPNDPGFGLSTLLQKQAAQLKALVSPAVKGSLGSVQAASVERLVTESAKTLEAQASAIRSKAVEAVQVQANRDFARRKKDAARRVQDELASSRAELDAGLKEVKAGTSGTTAEGLYRERARRLQGALGGPGSNLVSPGQRRQVEAAIRSAEAQAVASSVRTPPFLPARKPSAEEREKVSERNRMGRGVRGLTTLEGFSANLLNVAAWAAPVTALYKSFELASHSLSRFMELGRQTAQLSNVFRGVGGTAQQLTEDILKLAAAEGRDSEEGMASAQEWARLGLNRAQTNEAVRVSMEAANVADMHAPETTKQLSSLMHVYGMEVTDLAGVLGLLVSTSQRYNVTLEDLFQGLDRSAGVAKQAGMSLAELQGMIAAVVGKTGQSGVVVGNTLKSILVQFNNPEMQKYLRGFNIETTTKGGAQKGGSQVLREMFVTYQRLNDTERQNLTMRVAGRLQAARFVALMDNYIQAQRLAIDGQLHLNAAQEANARILGTMKAQLSGVRAEWDALITSTMSKSGPMGLPGFGQGLGQMFRTFKNVMRLGTAADAINPLTKKAPEPLKNVWRVGTIYGAASTLADFFNNAMESPLERGQAEFQNRVQRYSGAAAGQLNRQTLFQTVGQALQVAIDPQRRNAMAQMISPELGGRAEGFRKLVAGGDIKGAQAVLAQASKEAYGEAFTQKVKEWGERNNRITAAQGQLTAAQAVLESPASDERKAAARKAIAEAEEAITQARSDQKDLSMFLNEEEDGTTPEALARRQEFINLLKEQQSVMQAIAELSTQQTLGTATAQNQAVVAGLQQQRQLLEASAADLQGKPGMEAIGAHREVLRQLADVNADIAGRSSPRMQAELATMDARALAARRAAEEGQLGHVGRTEGERLLNQERWLKQQLGDAGRQQRGGTLTENGAVRAKEMEIQLWRTQEQIQSRILELTRQERQIRIDAQREFQKNTLLAGPEEQLQRLYVRSLLSRKMGSGEFYALSPELKRMYWEAKGGDAGALAREERAMLEGRGQSVEEQQRGQGAAGARVGAWGSALSQFDQQRMGQYPVNTQLPAYQEHVDAAKKAAEELGLMAKSASIYTEVQGAVTKELERFGALLMTMSDYFGGGGRNNTPAPKLGMSTGFAVGAMHP